VLDVVVFRQITDNSNCAPASATDVVSNLFGFIPVSTMNDHDCPFASERFSDSFANALAAAGHQGHLTAES